VCEVAKISVRWWKLYQGCLSKQRVNDQLQQAHQFSSPTSTIRSAGHVAHSYMQSRGIVNTRRLLEHRLLGEAGPPVHSVQCCGLRVVYERWSGISQQLAAGRASEAQRRAKDSCCAVWVECRYVGLVVCSFGDSSPCNLTCTEISR